MALYTFISEDCERDAQRHGQTGLLAHVKAHVEKTQNLAGFDFFLPTRFVKRSLGRNLRLIGYRVPFGDDELILFLRLLPCSSDDYGFFLANWEQNTDTVVRRFQPYGDEELQQIYGEATHVASLLPSPHQASAEERAWLYEVFPHDRQSDEPLVLETEAWVKKMRAKENSAFLALYHRMLYDLDLDQLPVASNNTESQILWEKQESDQRLGIAYLYRRDINRLLLLEPLRSTDEHASLLERHNEKLAKIGDEPHELSRVAARSYPFIMVLDQDAWFAIQKDEEANLALSPEEAELLDSIRQVGAQGELSYPLFINGRAGSGKSTMLQYLAADYIDFALRRDASQPLLYITCSPELLERARDTVRRLLTAHHERLLEGAHEPSKVDAVVKRSFAVFHDFLYSLLPPEMQQQLPKDRYVDYPQFRRLWANDFARRADAQRLSPDLAWHTIRSYIKGIRSSRDDELTPEEFEALPRRRRSVSKGTYTQVYERVWCSWYKRLCNEKNYWDDQDLAACVLETGVAPRIDCAALFCDEAQDFTPLELDIIYQLSLFGRRSLQPEELKRVPIVFAGDPLQTINPTGFRWETVRADFHDRFCAVLDTHRRARVNISYRELSFNYRSNPGIVKFCNLIQLARAALLGYSDIHPQEAWWVDEPIQTVWFAADTEATKEGLSQRPDFVKLVNCEGGEETAYVLRDPILRTLQEKVEGVYRNVFSPTRAKGLEFPAVVLYRFGETAPDEFEKILRGEVDINSPEARLPYEYFFNRLYVAASRAKGQLVIVDSNHALKKFWQFATDMELVDHLMEKAGGSDRWRGYIAHPVPGTENWWGGEKVDPRQQAEDYEREGRAKCDPYLLRQAALAHRSAGDEYAAGKCLAFAVELEGKHREAGDKYRGLGLHEDAFRCYWEGREWARLCDLAAQVPALTARPESRAADFMSRPAIFNPTFLNNLITAARDDAWFQRARSDHSWHFVFAAIAERLSAAKPDEALPWGNMLDILQRLRGAGVHEIKDAALAMVAYRANEFDYAVKLWESIGDTDGKEYRRAKAHVSPFPENIIWFGRIGEYGEVLRQWREHQPNLHGFEKLDNSIIRTVGDAALAERDLLLAAKMLQSSLDREREEGSAAAERLKSAIANLLATAIEERDVESAKVAAVVAARMFVRTCNWEAAIRAAEETDFSELLGSRAKDLQSMLRNTEGATNVFRVVVEELAVSDDLSLETLQRQVPVAEFLNRSFIGKGMSLAKMRGLSPQVVGAAIERAGKIIDALQFYETLRRSASTEEEVRQFAAERLVRNLERYAEYFRSKRDEARARQRQLRAQKIREQACLGDRKIPDYPVVYADIEPAEPTEWNRGPLRIVLSRPHRRLRIEHTERFETVTVYGNEGNLRGDANFSEVKAAGRELAAWEIIDWNVRVSLIAQDFSKGVVIEMHSDRFEFPLDISY